MAVFLAEVEEAGYDLTPVQYAAVVAVGANPGIDQATLAKLIAYGAVEAGRKRCYDKIS